MIRKSILFLLSLTISLIVKSQADAKFSEYNKAFTTYPFSDPNPIPDPSSKIYPYFRFDGFTDKPVQKEWKVVELENDFLKVMILPEVGGKIWAAIEKSTGKSFIYYNHVVKFRDVAMRGPWTSGGIEANYGIIGHTPNCATPVDYLVRKNADGSVSCFIGVLDLLTQTNWRVEINLPKDKAYLTTRSFWYNPTPFEQPYYTWMNTGIKAKGNLEFIYPGTKYIGHDGEYSDWPINKDNGKNISFYENNNFGGYKSYHVFGKYTDFFGAYWHDEDFGMGRYSTHADKAGKKIWIWGLSQQGMIWEKLLSDTDGQYVEVQSGRLYNQNTENSSLTPFKHRGFSAYSEDEWTEYWFPAKGTKGMVKANNWAVLNLRNENGWLKVDLFALQRIKDSLIIHDANGVVYGKTLDIAPAGNFKDSVKVASSSTFSVKLGKEKLEYNSDPNWEKLERPVVAPTNFIWNSAYGQWLMAKEYMNQKLYVQAEEKLRSSLALDQNYVPSLVRLAAIDIRNMKYDEALAMATHALSIDTHDGEANYVYGLANAALGDFTNAADGFDLASLAPEYHAAANIELSKLELRKGNFQQAVTHAQTAIFHDATNVTALSLQAIALRLLGETNEAQKIIPKILEIDPLNHLANYELTQLKAMDQQKFLSAIRNELPQQTLAELAGFYVSIDRFSDALNLLQSAGDDPVLVYEQAWLQSKLGQDFSKTLQNANTLKPGLNFPFRPETATALDWAAKQSKDWKPKYYLALIYHYRNRTEQASRMMSDLGSDPDWANFYIVRARMRAKDVAVAEADYKLALQKDPSQWRFHKELAEFYLANKQYDKALAITSPYYKAHPNDYVMGMLQARTLLQNKKFGEADQILSKIHVIPFEGSTDGRQLYKESKLMLALEAYKTGKYKDALNFIEQSKEWPDRLGSGKPYAEEIDERLENWLSYQSYNALKQADKAKPYLQKIIQFSPRVDNTVSNFSLSNHLVTAWAYKQLNQENEGTAFLKSWEGKYPQNQILKWAEARFKGESFQLPEGTHSDENYRIIEWLKVYGL